MNVSQEELKIIYLAESVLTEKEMRDSELELQLKLEKLLEHKVRIRKCVPGGHIYGCQLYSLQKKKKWQRCVCVCELRCIGTF